MGPITEGTGLCHVQQHQMCFINYGQCKLFMQRPVLGSVEMEMNDKYFRAWHYFILTALVQACASGAKV